MAYYQIKISLKGQTRFEGIRTYPSDDIDRVDKLVRQLAYDLFWTELATISVVMVTSYYYGMDGKPYPRRGIKELDTDVVKRLLG